MNIKDILRKGQGQDVLVSVLVTQVIQTSGPTLFKVTDGTGFITLKAFTGAGKRSYPEITDGMYVDASFTSTVRDGNVEGEVKSMRKTADEVSVRARIDKAQGGGLSAEDVSFIVSCPTTEKLKDRFVAAASRIQRAVRSGQPILIRHHNDCDGYSSGVVLQRALLPLLEQQHGKKDASRFVTRSVCRTPFYAFEDALRDVSSAMMGHQRFGEQLPLVLIVDNGSTEEDLQAIEQARIYGFEFIVIDHHPYGDVDVISDKVSVHINPYLVGEDYTFTAGMLCTELARLLHPKVDNINFIAAMAGMADHTSSDALDTFIALAAEEGYSRDYLGQLSRVIDYLAYNLRNLEGRGVIEDMFGANKTRQEQTCSLLYPIATSSLDKHASLAKHYGKPETIAGVTVQFLDVEKTFSRSSYPPAGRTTGLYHDACADERVVTIGHGSDFVTIRATEASKFDVHAALAYIKKHVPFSLADGGGHSQAGSIKFAPAAHTDVMQAMRNYISESL